MARWKRWRTARPLFIAVILGACLSSGMAACGFGNGPPPRKLTLTLVSDFPASPSQVTWSLAVDEPSAGRQIDTSQIGVMSGPFRIEYYSDAEWADAAPAMVRQLLVQSFRNTGRLPVVGSTRLSASADLMLISNLTKFQVETAPNGSSQAVVALEVTLLRLPRRNPIATARFEKATPIPANTIETVAAAFNESLADVIRHTVSWTLERGAVGM
jgi:cholesterol transport system auxiliary component